MNRLNKVQDLPNQDGFEFRAISLAGFVFSAVVRLDSDGIHRVYLTKRADDGSQYIGNPQTAKLDISTLAGWFPILKR